MSKNQIVYANVETSKHWSGGEVHTATVVDSEGNTSSSRGDSGLLSLFTERDNEAGAIANAIERLPDRK